MKTRYANEHGHAEVWRITPLVHVLHLLYVEPPYRGQGHASRLMRQVLTDADKAGVTLELQVAGDVKGENGMTDAALTAWYAQLGFVRDERYQNPGRMIRRPEAISGYLTDADDREQEKENG